MKCVRCGTELNENDRFCLGCGFEVGRRYDKPNTSETLESLMNMPVEEIIPNNEQMLLDEAEELDVDSDINYSENIAGEVVNIVTSNVSEGEILQEPKKKRKYWLFLGILLLIPISFGVYALVNYIVDIVNTQPPSVPKEDIKPSIINNPTSLYSFGNNFIVKLNNLWTLLDKGDNGVDVISSKIFITDGSTLTLNLYNFISDPLNLYIQRKKLNSNYEEIKINDEKYYLFTFENHQNYVKIIDNYLYAFEFFYSDNIDNEIEKVMNSVIFYN